MNKKKVCDLCGKKFTDQTNLSHHVNVEHKKVRFTCQSCGKKFTRKANRDAHQTKCMRSQHLPLPTTSHSIEGSSSEHERELQVPQREKVTFEQPTPQNLSIHDDVSEILQEHWTSIKNWQKVGGCVQFCFGWNSST